MWGAGNAFLDGFATGSIPDGGRLYRRLYGDPDGSTAALCGMVKETEHQRQIDQEVTVTLSTHRWFALSLAVDLSVACGSRSKVCSNLARARRALAWVSVSLNTTEPFISFI